MLAIDQEAETRDVDFEEDTAVEAEEATKDVEPVEDPLEDPATTAGEIADGQGLVQPLTPNVTSVIGAGIMDECVLTAPVD